MVERISTSDVTVRLRAAMKSEHADYLFKDQVVSGPETDESV